MDRLFADDLGERMDKAGLAPWRQRRHVEVQLNGVRKSLFVKRFENPPYRAARRVRSVGVGIRSIAGVEWHWMHHLRNVGISCPRPVAFGEEFTGTKEKRSVVVSAAVPGQSLEKWTTRWPEIESQRHRVLFGVARLIRQFHGLGLIHRDLYLSHIFFDPSLTDENGLSLIDLQRIFQPVYGKTRWVVKDLASLNYSTPRAIYSRADRLRWLRAYLGKAKLGRDGRKLAYRVIGKTLRVARREERRRVHKG